LLKAEDIHTYYGDSHILQGVSLDVGKGEVIGILGRNGMGKTTLIRSLIGFTPPRSGIVKFQDKEINDKRPFQIAKLGMSIVPQGRQIFPSLSVEENLKVVFRSTSDGWTLEKIYELFPPLRDRSDYPGNRLSGGEQQMLAIGRSLMTNPSLLLMDEPTEGLAPLFVQKVGEVIRKLQRTGISIILVEQNLQFTIKQTNYIHVMNRGMIVNSSSPKELELDHEIRSKYLGV
jgi:branched-chain amino acid transport system ATP-binding protein